MANFFKGMLRRANGCYGDLEGSATGLKKGRLSIGIEGNKCIAWAVGADDVELSKETVNKVEIVASNQFAQDVFGYSPNDKCMVNVYKIEMKNGGTGMLRLLSASEYKVLVLIK